MAREGRLRGDDPELRGVGEWVGTRVGVQGHSVLPAPDP